MTAEIAILNKAAVALAADSAVTISAGSREEKIFDTADKLFELSDANPLGIMIYNGMSFMEVPLPSLIRHFRSAHRKPVKRVQDAADHFLSFLDESGKAAPQAVKDRAIAKIVRPVLQQISDRVFAKFHEKMMSEGGDYKAVFHDVLNQNIDIYERVLQRRNDADFVGEGNVECNGIEELLRQWVLAHFPMADADQQERLLDVSKLTLTRNSLSDGRTGIVIAGFGDDDFFPTLVSVEIDGMVCDRLKFVRTNVVVIDREGPKAQVIPFAQKEMVERFLYGLDDEIDGKITTFCKDTVSNISDEVLKQVVFENDEARSALEISARTAEDAFQDGLRQRAFADIRRESKAEIEDMVEFMPKPELSKMAEALVNLTSIKRRVSRGMETVGGPIDVAVISQSEGFVWIKRKHYFPADLNARYFTRLRKSAEQQAEVNHGQLAKPGKARATRRRAANQKDLPDSLQGLADGSGGNPGGYPEGVS